MQIFQLLVSTGEITLSHGSARLKHGRLIEGVGFRVIMRDVVGDSRRLGIVLLVEIRFGHQQISVVNGLHIFLASNQHRMLVNGLGCLFYRPIQMRQCGPQFRFVRIIVHRQCGREVVFGKFGHFGFRLFHGLLSVPKHIVPACHIMIRTVGEGVLRCGARGDDRHKGSDHDDEQG